MYRMVREAGRYVMIHSCGDVDELFDDLVGMAAGLFESDRGLVELYRKRHRYISIDEYQDIDEMQYRLVRSLAPPDGDICAIGDPDQVNAAGHIRYNLAVKTLRGLRSI